MSSPRPADAPVHLIAVRNALRLAFLISLVTAFVAILLHHKGFVNLEDILGLPEEYLYYRFLGVVILSLVSLFFTWKCPGCGAYLGKDTSPTRCSCCGGSSGDSVSVSGDRRLRTSPIRGRKDS